MENIGNNRHVVILHDDTVLGVIVYYSFMREVWYCTKDEQTSGWAPTFRDARAEIVAHATKKGWI